LQKGLEAIQMADGRELWIINFDLTITHYVDDMCLTPFRNLLVKGTQVVKVKCGSASKGKWIVFKDYEAEEYAISNDFDNDMVIGTEDNEKFNNVCNDEGVIATATSNIGDNIHTASRGIESTKTPWISFKNE